MLLLLIDLGLQDANDLVDSKLFLSSSENYYLALQVGNESERKVLQSINQIMHDRLESEKKENIYQSVLNDIKNQIYVAKVYLVIRNSVTVIVE